jgi:hypothetical protein
MLEFCERNITFVALFFYDDLLFSNFFVDAVGQNESKG